MHKVLLPDHLKRNNLLLGHRNNPLLGNLKRKGSQRNNPLLGNLKRKGQRNNPLLGNLKRKGQRNNLLLGVEHPKQNNPLLRLNRHHPLLHLHSQVDNKVNLLQEVPKHHCNRQRGKQPREKNLPSKHQQKLYHSQRHKHSLHRVG
jgi:hypothetical protein